MTDDRDTGGATPAPSEAGCDAGAGARGRGGTGIGDEARRRIGRNLRLLYGSVLGQPLPERFTRLVDDLAADSSKREGS